MANLIKMMARAQEIQDRWNNLKDRKRAYESNETKWQQIFKRAGLETMCTECYAIMDTAFEPIKCIMCGSSDTVSPFYS